MTENTAVVGIKPFQEFCKHISLGQVNLARTFAESINEISADYIHVLENIAINPGCMNTTNECNNLSWLCSNLLKSFPSENYASMKNTPSKLFKEAEYRLMLQKLSEKLPHVVLKELHRLYCKALDNQLSSQSLTEISFVKLCENLNEDILQTSIILNVFFKVDQDSNPLFIDELYHKTLHNILNKIQSNCDKKLSSPNKNLIILSLFPEECIKNNSMANNLNLLATLVRDGSLSTLECYSALLGRDSPSLLLDYAVIENSFRLKDRDDLISTKTEKPICIEDLFLIMIQSGKHFIDEVLQICIDHILSGRMNIAWNLLSPKYLSPLRILAALMAWQQQSNHKEASYALKTIDSWEFDCEDPLFKKLINLLKHNASVTSWAATIWNYNSDEPESCFLQNKGIDLFNTLQRQSPLFALHKHFGIQNLPIVETVQALKKWESQRHESETFNFDENAILQAFHILNELLEAILCSSELDTLSEGGVLPLGNQTLRAHLSDYFSKEGLTSAYEEYVAKRLTNLSHGLSLVEPLEFRIELLENVFSLIFVTDTDFKYSEIHLCDSDEGHIGVDLKTSPDEETVEPNSGEENSASSYTATIKNQRGSSISSGSVGNIASQREGFLCNQKLLSDILSILNTLLVDAKTFLYRNTFGKPVEPKTNIQELDSILLNDIQKRVSQLIVYVKEAQWRLELLSTELPHHQIQRKISLDKRGDTKQKKRKRKKSKRCILQTSTLDTSNVNIVQRMLASPETLLRNAILQRNYAQADQVIRLFQLKNTHDAIEAKFSENLPRLIFKVNTSSNSNIVNESSISSLALAATSGFESTEKMLLVDNHLEEFPAPVCAEIELLQNSATASEMASIVLEDAQISDMIVVADMAYTSCLLPNKGAMLLSLGLRKVALNENQTSKKSTGVIGFAKNMLEFCSEVLRITKDSGLEEASPCYPFQRLGLRSLFYCLGPLDAAKFVKNVESWREYLYHTELLSKMLRKEKECQVTILQSQDESETDGREADLLHSAFNRLIKFISKATLSGSLDCSVETATTKNYLRALFRHVRKVSNVLTKCQHSIQGLDWMCDSSYFAVLSYSPSGILGQLVLQRSVPLAELEQFSEDMQLDLVLVIVRTCLPKILNSAEKTPVKKNSTLTAASFIQSATKLLDQPELLSRNLLSQVIQLIEETCSELGESSLTQAGLIHLCQKQELTSWLASCLHLEGVDLSKLNGEEEKLSFFGNTFNVLWIRTIMLDIGTSGIILNQNNKKEASMQDLSRLFSPHVSERVTKQYLSQYNVGQMKHLSLLELKFALLYRNKRCFDYFKKPPLNQAFDSLKVSFDYLPSCEAKMLFLLCDTTLSSPKLQVLSPIEVRAQIQDATIEYLSNHVELNSSCEIIKLPKLLVDHCELFVTSTQNLENNNEESLIRFVSCNVTTDLESSIQNLLALNFNHSENGDGNLPFKLEIAPFNATFGIVRDYASVSRHDIDKVVSKNVHAKYELPDHLDEYISNRCGLISEFIHTVSTTPSINDSNKSVDVKLGPFQRKLVSSLALRNWTNIWEEVAPILNPCCATDIWTSLQALIDLGDYLKALRLIDDQEGVDDLPSDLELLKEWLLCALALTVPSREISEPWSHALRLKHNYRKCELIMEGLNNWPFEACIQMLKICISIRCATPEYLQLKSTMIRKIKEISLYEKIVKAVSYDSKWRDVLRTWQNARKMASENLPTLIEALTSYPLLAVSCSEFYEIVPPSLRKTVTELHVQCLLTSNSPETEKVALVLSSLIDLEDQKDVCLKLLKSTDDYSGRLFLVHHLLNGDFNLGVDLARNLQQQNIGLRMLSALSSEDCADYESLFEHPLLLLEQMIMNMEFDHASKALNSVSKTMFVEPFTWNTVNACIENYASQALEFCLCDVSPEQTIGPLANSPKSTELFVLPTKAPAKSEWVSDYDVATCMVCQLEHFSMFLRRHHCRRCGRVVSSNCSQHSMIVAGYSNIPVRVCDDCYEQTLHSSYFTSPSAEKYSKNISNLNVTSSPGHKTEMTRQRSATVSSFKVTPWLLSSDFENNAAIREEFCFEQAPSVPLCLSVLQLHGELQTCAKFIMKQCHQLFNMLTPRSSGAINQEVDYALVISMMRSLVLSAKVKFVEAKDNKGIANCDNYSSSLDLVNLLVKNNCVHLIPSQDITNNEVIRRISDRLIEEERMNLALEVSTKFGLDVTSVWATWAKLRLKTGDWPSAREKFSYCLQKPKDLNQQKQENPLLDEVINIIESSGHNGSVKCGMIYQSLSSLKGIQYGMTKQNLKEERNSSILEECSFYLKLYGSHFSVVSFYQKHGMYTEALKYIDIKCCDSDTFFVGLFLPSVKVGQLNVLLRQLQMNDESLEKWWKHLMSTCLQLQQQGLYHVLYKVQIFMEDYLRAAMTSIHFFRSPAKNYEDLFERLHHLTSARNNYEIYGKSVMAPKNTSPNRKVLKQSTSAIKGHIETIALQTEVTIFLHACKKQNLLENVSMVDIERSIFTEPTEERMTCPPTCFDSVNRRTALAVTLMLYGTILEQGLALSVKIIMQQRLECNRVCKILGLELVKFENVTNACTTLLNYFQTSIIKNHISCDFLVECCVKELCKKTGQGKELALLVKLIENNVNKIESFIACRKLKSAYLLAIRLERVEDVKRIAEVAKQEGQDSMASICEKWLLYKQKDAKKD